LAEASTAVKRAIDQIQAKRDVIEKSLGITLKTKKGWKSLDEMMRLISERLAEVEKSGKKITSYSRRGKAIGKSDVGKFIIQTFGERGQKLITAMLSQARVGRNVGIGGLSSYEAIRGAGGAGTIEARVARKRQLMGPLEQWNKAVNKFRNQLYQQLIPVLGRLGDVLPAVSTGLNALITGLKFVIDNWKVLLAIYTGMKMRKFFKMLSGSMASGAGGAGGAGGLAGMAGGGMYMAGGLSAGQPSGARPPPIPADARVSRWSRAKRAMTTRAGFREMMTKQRSGSAALGRLGALGGYASMALAGYEIGKAFVNVVKKHKLGAGELSDEDKRKDDLRRKKEGEANAKALDAYKKKKYEDPANIISDRRATVFMDELTRGKRAPIDVFTGAKGKAEGGLTTEGYISEYRRGKKLLAERKKEAAAAHAALPKDQQARITIGQMEQQFGVHKIKSVVDELGSVVKAYDMTMTLFKADMVSMPKHMAKAIERLPKAVRDGLRQSGGRPKSGGT
jgi:hypothetical protein